MTKKPTRVVVTGVSGRMGSLLVRLVRDADDLTLTGGTDKPGSAAIGLDVGLAAHLGALEVETVDSLDKALASADVVIDFTTPEASVAHARACAAAKVPLVVGSTGFSADAKAEMAAAARQVPVVMSPNMSVGVNLVIETARELARRLGDDFDIEVVETHHRMKKDAPSGTALRLAEELAAGVGRSTDVIRTSRVGQVGERPRREIGVQALRGGDVVGEHTVFFFGDGERVELTHRATSREQFGRGALRAARWVVGQPPGLYDMTHVLKG
ncbi:MAG: 4-hydroxy-tetrahydrodipicolinate reductase [Myxococcota bacterium]